MSVMQCACPKCQMPLQIAQALPAHVQCPRCSAVFTVGGPAPVPAAQAVARGPRSAPMAPPMAVQSAPARASAPAFDHEPLIQRRRPPRRSALPWVLGIGGILAIVAVFVIVLLLNKKPAVEPFDRPTPGRAADPRQAKIDRAIARGVAYLKKQINEGSKDYYFNDTGAGSQVGVVALAGLTLLECDEPSSDKAVRKAIDTVRQAAPTLHFTYSLAIAILFLDRWYESKDRAPEARDRELIQRIATQMIASQNANGGWDYSCKPISDTQHQKILADLNAGRPIPTVGDKDDHSKGDNSINQFCTLALWAARKYNVKTDASLKMIEDRYRRNQNDNGSWGYKARDDGFLKGGTTCAGLIGLAVGQGVDADRLAKEKDKGKGKKPAVARNVIKDDPAIKKGLAYITEAIGWDPRRLSKEERVSRHEHTKKMMDLYRAWHDAPPDEKGLIKNKLGALDNATLLKGTYFGADCWGDLYFLWSVERVGMIFGLVKSINGKDWYGWGSDVIVKNQKEDGSWRDRFPGVCDTCFALLFLKRANVAKDLTDKLQVVGAPPVISAAPQPPRPDPFVPRRPMNA